MAPPVSFALRGSRRETAPRQALPKKPVFRPEESRRPLYLSTKLKAQVDIDGPALRVRSAGLAEARYPLYRVSRVIAGTGVDWSSEALRACLESGIPIVIVARDGIPLGSVQPACIRPSRLSADIDELLDRPDWHEIYQNWLRAMRMKAVEQWRMSREASGKTLNPGELKEMVRKFVYGAPDTIPSEDTPGIWHAALCAFAASALRQAGLQSAYWGAGGTTLNLLGDVTRLLELRLCLEVGVDMMHGLADEAVVLRVFHALSSDLDGQCVYFLASLARRVRQALAEWH